MNNFYNKLERKFGRYCINNLTLYLICGYIVGYIAQLIAPTIFQYITLDPYAIMHGQVWRLITWVISPPSELGIFTIIMLFFYYSIGKSLENTWGAFRYNIYIFSGIIFTIIGAFAAYFMMAYGGLGLDVSTAVIGNEFRQYIGVITGSCISTYYVSTSIMLAFAATFPDSEVYLYMLIPIKMKWFGIFYAVILAYDFYQCGLLPIRIIILASMLNFIIFFLTTRNYKRVSPTHIRQKQKFMRANAPVNKYENGALHKCHICGRTEKDGDDLVFRYCSKCQGNYEYCQEHLFTHQHIQK